MTFLTVNSEKHLLKHLKIKSVTTYCSTLSKSKSPRSFLRGLLCDRQQSILPGRFQPSTFDAWELNCCVRDGNRWGLPAIVTGSLNRLFVFPLRQACVSLARHTSVCLRGARWPFLAASTKILIHSFRSSQTLNTVQKKLLAKTNAPCLPCLSCFQIKPSTD